jgi:site-specific DNA-methyltransferase (adenine-specific)
MDGDKTGTADRRQLPVNQIICGDNCDVLGTFPRECIDLVVTSPPYDDLRTYGGHSWDFYGVAWQLKRVLKPGGVIVWVVADAVNKGKSLASWDQVRHFSDLELDVWDVMTYEKGSFLQPTKNVRRYIQLAEYMFVLSKGVPYRWNPICDVPNLLAGERHKIYANNAGREGMGEGKEITINEFRRRSNVWKYTTGLHHSTSDAIAFDHPAIFPEALARDHILSWSNEGDIVLDPFNGSGTTTKMAREMGRQYIGIEVNPDYCEIARKRLAQRVLFGPEKEAVA